MQLLPHITDPIDQCCLDVHMHIFEFGLPLETSLLDVVSYRIEPGNNLIPLRVT